LTAKIGNDYFDDTDQLKKSILPQMNANKRK